MNALQVKNVVELIFGAYPTQRARMQDSDVRAMFAAYQLGLGDLDEPACMQAVARLVMSSKWIPTIAEIRAEVGVVVHGDETVAVQQWGEVSRRIKRYGQSEPPGHGRNPPFEDPITRQVVYALSWFDLCASTTPAADRKNFVEAYQQMQKQERKSAQLSPGAISKTLPHAKPQRQISGETRSNEERGLGAIVGCLLPEGETP